MMFANTAGVVIIAIGVVTMMAPSHFWSLRYVFSDVSLFVLAVGCYWLATHRRKGKTMEKDACKEVEDEAVPAETQKKQQLDDEYSELLQKLQKYASERNISGTMRTFRSIQKSEGCVSSLVYNTVLQAFINCGNVQGAEDWLDTIVEAGKADATSFTILVKGLVEAHALDKARDLLRVMRRAGIQPSSTTFDNILFGLAKADRFNDSLSLLDEMHARGVQPTIMTLHTIEKLLNDSRKIDQSLSRIWQILRKFKLQAKSDATAPAEGTSISLDSHALAELPRLAAVISQAEEPMSSSCAHEVHVTGSLPQIKAVRRTLKQHGFLDNTEKDSQPLDGHWETDDGLTVVIEGKLVRWSGQHASRLSYVGDDRRACMLTLYGKPTKGHAVSPPVEFQATKTLRWDNGDTWHSYDGRAIGQDVFYSQSMTKTLRDKAQDEAHQARSCAVLKCVSKQGLGMPLMLEDAITQFLGGDLYYVRMQFQSKWNPSRVDDEDDSDLPLLQDTDADICSSLSLRHPCVGLRHCWAEPGTDQCGQRTLVNGEEVNEDCFKRQIRAVYWT